MNFNISSLSSLFAQVDSHVEAFWELDGKRYEIEHFRIEFGQEMDYKGQPQHETRGGLFSVTITQSVDDNIYDWAKRANKLKSGKVLFISKSEGTIMELNFINASCIKLTRSMNALSGTQTILVIAPEKVDMNGFEHDNHWRS